MKSTNSLHRKYATAKFLTYFALIVGSLIMIFPFVWMLLTSFKTQAESVSIPATFFPSEFRLDGYKKVLENLPFIKLYWNTILLVFFRVVCAIVFSSMAGYAFAKLHFRGKNILFTIVLMQMSLPSQIFLIPQYQMVAKMGLANTIFALVFPGIVSAFGVFFLRQTYMSIPDEIGEAAYLDAYGDLMWPQIVNNDVTKFTLSAGLATLRGMDTTNFPMLMAGSMLAMLPMIVLYLIFQRQFVEGIAGTGGK